MRDEELRDHARRLNPAERRACWERLLGDDPMQEWGGRGYALETLFIRELEVEGVEVNYSFRVGSGEERLGTLEQVDGVLYLPWGTFLVESKCAREAVDVEPLAKLRLRLEGRPPGLMGLLLSWGGFTMAAQLHARYVSPLNVLLWTREDVIATLEEGLSFAQTLRFKWKMAVERREAMAPVETLLLSATTPDPQPAEADQDEGTVDEHHSEDHPGR